MTCVRNIAFPLSVTVLAAASQAYGCTLPERRFLPQSREGTGTDADGSCLKKWLKFAGGVIFG